MQREADNSEPSRFCQRCAYPLDGLGENRCPECGRPFDPEDSETFDGPRARIGHRHLIAALVGLGVLCVSFVIAGLASQMHAKALAAGAWAPGARDQWLAWQDMWFVTFAGAYLFEAGVLIACLGTLGSHRKRACRKRSLWIAMFISIVFWISCPGMFFLAGFSGAQITR